MLFKREERAVDFRRPKEREEKDPSDSNYNIYCEGSDPPGRVVGSLVMTEKEIL